MQKNRVILALMLSSALTACAASPTLEATTLQSVPEAAVCCNNFSEFPWLELGTNEQIEFSINADSPVGRFAEGNSYFAAFKLPARSSKVNIQLASHMVNGEVFAPKLITLDKAFNIVNINVHDSFDIETTGMLTRTQYQLSFTLDVEKTPYFIVYTDESELGDSIQIPHPAKERAVELGQPMPMVTDPKYTYEAFGSLEVAIKTLSLAAPSRTTETQKAAVVVAPVKLSAPASATMQTSSAVSSNTKSASMSVHADTRAYYFESIRAAVKNNQTSKAMTLLEEANRLGIDGAQKVFVDAVDNK
ncbi:MalM family protein [Vibrio harveyi]|uniref:MalM family protein n=2 Tax=Vibrio harveyi TaxID=669 RepID=UPI002380035C|nr:MalM family protein [Vibrio harveyi]